MSGNMREVSKDEYLKVVLEAEAFGGQSVPVHTESNHPAAPHLAAMQTMDPNGVLVAQAVYWRGSEPKYEVRP